MSLSVYERMEEFNTVLLNSLIPVPENMSIKELAEKTHELIDKLQLLIKKIFDISSDIEEQVCLGWHLKRIQNYKKDLERNEYTVYLIFSYVASLSQGIKVYQREFNLI